MERSQYAGEYRGLSIHELERERDAESKFIERFDGREHYDLAVEDSHVRLAEIDFWLETKRESKRSELCAEGYVLAMRESGVNGRCIDESPNLMPLSLPGDNPEFYSSLVGMSPEEIVEAYLARPIPKEARMSDDAEKFRVYRHFAKQGDALALRLLNDLISDAGAEIIPHNSSKESVQSRL